MAIIVEDGTGLSNSETYISVAEADTYHANRGNDAWAALTNTVKEQLLRKSTDYLSAVYGSSWAGYPVKTTQALDFPRRDVPAPLGWYDYNVIPVPLKQAQAELALIAATTTLMPTTQTRGKKKVKVGPIEVEYDGTAPTAPKFLFASAKIDPLLKAYASSGVMVKLERS